MDVNSRLMERLHPVWAAAPKDITGAGVSGDWVNLKHYRRLLIAIFSGAWAGGTSAITLEQATDAAGTSGKALAFEWQWVSTGLTADVSTKTAVTSSTFNVAAANKLHLVEIMATDLDQQNGFHYVRVVSATPGSNADLLAVLYVLGDPHYPATPASQPTAIT